MSFKIISYNNIFPSIDKEAYIAANTCIIGDVIIGNKSSVWYNCVLRGDVAPIRVGCNTNIQDGTVIHTSRFNGPVIIGDNITIGHCCLIHAATIENNAFIGMRATIMDYSVIEPYGFVAAGSLVPPNKIVKSKELWMGAPAKFTRYLTDKELNAMLDNTLNYINLTKNYLSNPLA
ncbi:gamma carbonic anhydrase family protein [Candidatus Tisiphia endosymbiont of Nemotelus uliginosus]|uniref:gamma carbonic anhydrase family protein n=1 Tax=Candidatus Tisiphia endosymbiont of Nemotelus uliginosus TaxID=3077926 RepID=UPI0035C91E12